MIRRIVLLLALVPLIYPAAPACAEGPHSRMTQSGRGSNTEGGVRRYNYTPRGTQGGNAENGLPTGRRYYNGRYFGNLNNRFYGPQYGYF